MYTFDEIKQAAKDAGLDRQHRYELYKSLPPKAAKKTQEPVPVTWGQYVRRSRDAAVCVILRSSRPSSHRDAVVAVQFLDGACAGACGTPVLSRDLTTLFGSPIKLVLPQDMP